MNVKTVCLSILYEGDSTGYEIRRRSIEGECSYFVEASFGSIYPALAKLEGEGLVTSRVEQQDGKPAKKIYSITETGRTAFVNELFEPLGEEVFRSPFLLFARFAHLLPADLVETRLNQQIDRIAEKRRHIEELAADHDMSETDSWVLRHALFCLGQAHAHMRDHMNELVALAKPVAALSKAAE